MRLRYGPELKDVAPQYAKQFEQARGDQDGAVEECVDRSENVRV